MVVELVELIGTVTRTWPALNRMVWASAEATASNSEIQNWLWMSLRKMPGDVRLVRNWVGWIFILRSLRLGLRLKDRTKQKI
jgi:hypothetical protein